MVVSAERAVFVLAMAVALLLTPPPKAVAAAEPADECRSPPDGCYNLYLYAYCSHGGSHCGLGDYAPLEERCCEALYDMRADKCATCDNLNSWFYGLAFDPRTCTNGVGYYATHFCN